MSIDAIRWAFQQQGLPSSVKFVLIALADRANEDDECYPSRDLIHLDTGLNKETISRATEELVRLGLVEKRRRFGGSTVYHLIGVPGRHQLAGKPASRKTGHQLAGKPAIGEPENRLLTTNEPSMNRNNPPEPPRKRVAKTNKRTALPDDFSLTPDLERRACDYWAERKRHDLDAADEFERFRAHHMANGSRMANWSAAWTTWYTNSVRFNRASNGGTHNGQRQPTDRPDNSAAGRIRANVQRELAEIAAAEARAAGVATDGQPVRAQVVERIRGQGRP